MDIRLNIFDAAGIAAGLILWLHGDYLLGITAALAGVAVSEVYEYFKGERR